MPIEIPPGLRAAGAKMRQGAERAKELAREGARQAGEFSRRHYKAAYERIKPSLEKLQSEDRLSEFLNERSELHSRGRTYTGKRFDIWMKANRAEGYKGPRTAELAKDFLKFLEQDLREYLEDPNFDALKDPDSYDEGDIEELRHEYAYYEDIRSTLAFLAADIDEASSPADQKRHEKLWHDLILPLYDLNALRRRSWVGMWVKRRDKPEGDETHEHKEKGHRHEEEEEHAPQYGIVIKEIINKFLVLDESASNKEEVEERIRSIKNVDIEELKLHIRDEIEGEYREKAEELTELRKRLIAAEAAYARAATDARKQAVDVVQSELAKAYAELDQHGRVPVGLFTDEELSVWDLRAISLKEAAAPKADPDAEKREHAYETLRSRQHELDTVRGKYGAAQAELNFLLGNRKMGRIREKDVTREFGQSERRKALHAELITLSRELSAAEAAFYAARSEVGQYADEDEEEDESRVTRAEVYAEALALAENNPDAALQIFYERVLMKASESVIGNESEFSEDVLDIIRGKFDGVTGPTRLKLKAAQEALLRERTLAREGREREEARTESMDAFADMLVDFMTKGPSLSDRATLNSGNDRRFAKILNGLPGRQIDPEYLVDILFFALKSTGSEIGPRNESRYRRMIERDIRDMRGFARTTLYSELKSLPQLLRQYLKSKGIDKKSKKFLKEFEKKAKRLASNL